MKKVAILCQTAPGGKRRLAEEALRLATGLTATGRLQVDLILTDGGTALLQPEMGGPIGTWESLQSPHTRILIPSDTRLPPSAPPVIRLANCHPEKASAGADIILRF